MDNERFQNNQDTPDATGEANTPDNSYIVKENKLKGSQLKQEVAAAVISQGKGAGSGVNSVATPASLGRKAGVYTGAPAFYLENAGGTPNLSKDSQGKSREGKKLSDPNKDINQLASEQYATYFQEPPALYEEKDALVGYNGNPANIPTRARKSAGSSPADPLYDRSVDEIRKDVAIFTTGQVNKANDVEYRDYPTKSAFNASGQAVISDVGADITLTRGNYMPTAIKAEISRDANGVAYLSSFSVDEINLGASRSVDLNSVAGHQIADLNAAEMARQNVDAKYGSPSMERFNPLGRSVQQPSQTMMYLRDIESTTGAMMAGAIRFASKSRSYFLSRTGKDGILNFGPALDALYGHLDVKNASSAYPADDTSASFFDVNGMRAGSAATLILTYDSEGKYKTKADIVNQPRGLKLPLSTGLNNYTPFRVKKDFIASLNANDVFSTIDREYDPSSPVCVTGGIRYIIPYSWNSALAFTRSSAGAGRSYSSHLFGYSYQAGKGNARYFIKVADPILNGVAWFIEQHIGSIAKALNVAPSSYVNWTIPILSSGTHFSLWDYLLCAASADILYERTNTMKDILDLESYGDYPFDFENLTEDVVLQPTNYGRISMYDRLSVKQMKPVDAVKWIYPELFTPISSDAGMRLLPWYISGSSYKKTAIPSGANANLYTYSYDESDPHFPAPVIRSGVRSALLDDFYNESLQDILLAADPIVGLTGFTGADYNYSVSGGSLVAADINGIGMSEFLGMPRMVGWSFDLPEGVANAAQWMTSYTDFSSPASISNLRFDHSSYRARAYYSATDIRTSAITSFMMNRNRASAFAQQWVECYASHKSSDASQFDTPMSIAALVARDDANNAFSVSYSKLPSSFITDGTEVNNARLPKLFSIFNFLWARIQKLPFIFNPFDSGYGNSSQTIGSCDPLDFAYLFGLAGFRDVSYSELVSTRELEFMAKQFNYVRDYYTEVSPIHKD